MFTVCDANLRILSEWSTLAAAKASARIRANKYPGHVFFVCNHMGMIVAGW